MANNLTFTNSQMRCDTFWGAGCLFVSLVASFARASAHGRALLGLHARYFFAFMYLFFTFLGFECEEGRERRASPATAYLASLRISCPHSL